MRAMEKNSKRLQNNGIMKFKKCGQWKRTAKDYKTME